MCVKTNKSGIRPRAKKDLDEYLDQKHIKEDKERDAKHKKDNKELEDLRKSTE